MLLNQLWKTQMDSFIEDPTQVLLKYYCHILLEQ